MGKFFFQESARRAQLRNSGRRVKHVKPNEGRMIVFLYENDTVLLNGIKRRAQRASPLSSKKHSAFKSDSLFSSSFFERAGKLNLETVSKDDIVRRQLRAIGVKNTIHYSKQAVVTSALTFDDAHINGERQHGRDRD